MRTEREAETAGKASALFGADIANCHFSFFATPALTKAWERGRDIGERERRVRALMEMG